MTPQLYLPIVLLLERGSRTPPAMVADFILPDRILTIKFMQRAKVFNFNSDYLFLASSSSVSLLDIPFSCFGRAKRVSCSIRRPRCLWNRFRVPNASTSFPIFDETLVASVSSPCKFSFHSLQSLQTEYGILSTGPSLLNKPFVAADKHLHIAVWECAHVLLKIPEYMPFPGSSVLHVLLSVPVRTEECLTKFKKYIIKCHSQRRWKSEFRRAIFT